MAAEPKNVLFQFSTKVTDAGDPVTLASNIEKTDDAYAAAQKTVEQFDRGVAKSLQTWKAAREEQGRATAGMGAFTAKVKEGEAQIGSMKTTIGGAQKALHELVGIDKQASDFLVPFIKGTDKLGNVAAETAGDMDHLLDQAKALANVPAPVVAPQRTQPRPGAVPTTTGPDEALRENTEQVHQFAEAMLRLATTGTITFEELKAAAQKELVTLKELNAEAAKTPLGDAALKAPLDAAQKEALDLLVTTKAINVEERTMLEQATKIANARRQAPAGTSATAPATIPPESIGIIDQYRARVDALQAKLKDATTVEQVAAVNRELTAARANLAELQAQGTDPIIPPENLGIIERLQQHMSALQKMKIRATDEGTIARLNDQIGRTEQELKRVQSIKLDDAPRKAGSLWISLRRQMQEAKAVLDSLIESSDGRMTKEIIAAAKYAGHLQDRFEDLQAVVTAFNPDKKFQVFAGAIQHVVGGFAALQGVMGLVGLEGEGVEKALLKVTSALAVSQGLQQLFGGLKDTLRNLRTLLLSTAAGQRLLAAAEAQAAAGAVTQATATTGLRGALNLMKVAAAEAAAALAAPAAVATIIVGSLAVIAFGIYQLTKSAEEAKVAADDLFTALDRVSKVRLQEIERNRTVDELQNEREALTQILALEKERAAIPSTFTADQKALANLRIDEKIAAIQRTQRFKDQAAQQQQLANQEQLLNSQRFAVQEQIEKAYKRAGQTFVETEGDVGKAASDRASAQMNMSQAEMAQALQFARVKDALSKEEGEDLDKLFNKREEIDLALKKASADRIALFEKEKLKRVQDEVDITKAFQREAELRAKIAADRIIGNTIQALQKEQQRLLDIITKKAVIRSPEFFAAIELYQQVTKELKAAQDLLKESEAFPVGSLQDLNQELAFLKDVLSRLPEGAADFDTVKNAVNELEAAIAALNEKLKPADPKAITAAKLAELEEERRHTLAIADLDAQAAVTRARNAKKSEGEIKKIEEQNKAERLRLELDFERKRLLILQAAGKDKEAEVRASLNRIKELEAQLQLPEDTTGDDKALREHVERVRDAAQQVAQAGIDAWQAWSDAQTRSLDQQISLQQQRIADALKIADKGNSEILEKERERLKKMTDERRKAAERNAAIAQLEAAANAVVAITKAAAEGGGWLSAVTIAATLIALTAGLVQARSLATDAVPTQGFHRGIKYVDKHGRYPTGVDTVPANLTRGERVVDALTSATHRQLYDGLQDKNRDAVRAGLLRTAHLFGLRAAIMDNIPAGRKPMREMVSNGAYMIIKQGEGISDKHVKQIVDAIHDAPKTDVTLDADGFSVTVTRRAERRAALRSRL